MWTSVWDADTVLRSLWILVVAATATSVVLLVVNWPVGGGERPSEMVIAQGASLIFVAIVVGLLLGPVEAARGLGLDASWIARDAKVWTGLAAVAFVSLCELWIGSIGPDRGEELATLSLTSAGLGVTGLLARRVIRLADPSAQLSERVKGMAGKIRDAVAHSDERRRHAIGAAGVSPSLPELPDHTAQAECREIVRQVLDICRAALGRGHADLVTEAHRQAAILVKTYVDAVKGFSSRRRGPRPFPR